MMHRFGHHWIYGHPWTYGPPSGNGVVLGPGIFLTVLSILFLGTLFIGLVWALLMWIRPMLTSFVGLPPANNSALEILRQRYAAGEIDANTFEQMWERLVASYQQISNELPGHDYNYQETHWTGYRSTYTSPASGQRKLRMAEQEQYLSETDI